MLEISPSEVVRFIAFGTPRPQGSKTRTRFGGLRESSKYLPAWRQAIVDAWAYEQLTNEDYETYKPKEGPVEVEFGFFFLRPKSHRNAKGHKLPSAPMHFNQKPDLDKLCRAVCDAIVEARIILDDSQVVLIKAEKVWDETDEGVNIVVRDYKGYMG